MSSIIACTDLYKQFTNLSVAVLNGVNFSLQAGEKVAIVGTSGSGKSTLLHILGGLEPPSHGEVFWQGQALAGLNSGQQATLRNQYLGFVYQFHHLLPEFSALENVAMPLLIRGTPTNQALSVAETMLKAVDLGQRLQHLPSELSGGERQRAAVARALVTSPLCLLADEPTGNLDRHSALQVFELLQTLNPAISIVVVTHDMSLAKKMMRVYTLMDGVLHSN